MNEINKTEESLFTLLSLSILAKQHFDTLLFHNKNFYEFVKKFKDNELPEDSWIIENTIYESLVHQIILKACSFIEEWNKSLGVITTKEDKEKIMLFKKAVKPASQSLNKLVEVLRFYRNEAIAHNHRDKKGNIYLHKKKYDAPDSINEIMLIVFYMDTCVSPINKFFPFKVSSILNSMSALHSKALNPPPTKMNHEEVNNIMITIQEQIEKNLLELLS